MALRTHYSSNDSLSRELILSYQPYAPAMQALVQFKNMERGVRKGREQAGEVDATGPEGPHACASFRITHLYR